MIHFMRRSLLFQLLSVYLLFVIVVLISGVAVDALVEQQLRSNAQVSDQALAQEIALQTSVQLHDSEDALSALGKLVVQAHSADTITADFRTFQAARNTVDHVYWLDPVGGITVSWPPVGVMAEFSPPTVVQQARLSKHPVFEVGIVGFAEETPVNPGVIIAAPMRSPSGDLVGIVAASLSLQELSDPLTSVVQAQQRQQRRLLISIIDDQGRLVATPDRPRILQTVLDQLPGADVALHGRPASLLASGPDGRNWLFSAVPVADTGWAVVVQRPESEALAVVTQFHLWLFIAALLFSIGGLFFWFILLIRVIRPLHTLAIQHQVLPTSEGEISVNTMILAQRSDEVGGLARSLVRLERDGLEKLGELQTLLETSSVVVSSLEPYAVVKKIICEVRRLVDVQAAAVLLPDEQGVLHVMVSDGHSEHYNHDLALLPENTSSSAVQALRKGEPVQKILTSSTPTSLSYEEGFNTVLAIPIISRHAGGVVLSVHRTEAQPFNQNEINLLLTFANYATLAWEHAVLYERSDERLREVAGENEHLYRQASEEKQRLEAIMSSMNDGLILTAIDGTILYANSSAHALVGIPNRELEGRPTDALFDALRSVAINSDACEHLLSKATSAEIPTMLVEIAHSGLRKVLHVRPFDVYDECKQSIGRGLLLRDVTREHELDQFKTTLLAAVGHELRTPLTAIKGYASTLLQEDVTWSLADQRHFLQIISDEADRLAQLVSNLLDLSRQEAGLLSLNREPVNVQYLVVKTLERLPHSNGIVTVHIPEHMPLVYVDAARIEVVLHNLIANALAYGNDEIHITARSNGTEVIVSVSDNGPGIARDELPHVFERFYRAHHGRQQRSGGTGLGLTICKAFVEAHECDVWIEESAAQGTTISFTLPLLPQNINKTTHVLSAQERTFT